MHLEMLHIYLKNYNSLWLTNKIPDDIVVINKLNIALTLIKSGGGMCPLKPRQPSLRQGAKSPDSHP